MKKMIAFILITSVLCGSFSISLAAAQRAEPCETCNEGMLRPNLRRGSRLETVMCTHQPWETHELYEIYYDYICDNCGTYEYSVYTGDLWYCTEKRAYSTGW